MIHGSGRWTFDSDRTERYMWPTFTTASLVIMKCRWIIRGATASGGASGALFIAKNLQLQPPTAVGALLLRAANQRRLTSAATHLTCRTHRPAISFENLPARILPGAC